MKKASHLGKDAWPFFLVKVLKPLFIRFPIQGKSLANRSGFVLHFLLAALFAAGWFSAFDGIHTTGFFGLLAIPRQIPLLPVKPAVETVEKILFQE